MPAALKPTESRSISVAYNPIAKTRVSTPDNLGKGSVKSPATSIMNRSPMVDGISMTERSFRR